MESQATHLARDMRRLELPVIGMTCAGCAGHVERALAGVPGVARADVNLATQRATVTAAETVTHATLVQAVIAAGYGVAEATTSGETRRAFGLSGAFWLSLAMSLPVLLLGMAHGLVPSSLMLASRSMQMALATGVLLGPGRRFFRAGWNGMSRGAVDMNTLIALGSGATWLYSSFAVIAPGWLAGRAPHAMPDVYFEAAVAIVTFVLLGKDLEARARGRLADSVRALLALTPVTAHRLVGSSSEWTVEDAPMGALREGDVFLVRPGERVVTDGVVLEGTSWLDEAMLTGESVAVPKEPGDTVYGATQNQAGSLVVRASSIGPDTALGRIVLALERAQGSKAPIADLADRVCRVFVPVVLAIALATGVLWWMSDPSAGGLPVALQHFVAVLVVACPCALGLATPAAVAVGTGRGAELGVLIRGGESLEAASRIDTVLLDKTGTLTCRRPEVIDIVPFHGETEAHLLAYAAGVEQRSEHPLGAAIVRAATERGVVPERVTEFVAEVGSGVEGVVRGHRVRLGVERWVGVDEGEKEPLRSAAQKVVSQGRSVVFASASGRALGIFGFADSLAPGAMSTVATLLGHGLAVGMLTGDRMSVARPLAEALGIRDVVAEISPEGKAAVVRERQRAGARVAMVGDGINDAPALAQADVGIAVGGGADITASAADIVLLRGGVGTLWLALRLARATMQTIRRNLFWAFVYNAIGIPIAAGALERPLGWHLSPVLASAGMSLSSLSVLVSSLRLRSFGDRRRDSADVLG